MTDRDAGPVITIVRSDDTMAVWHGEADAPDDTISLKGCIITYGSGLRVEPTDYAAMFRDIEAEQT